MPYSNLEKKYFRNLSLDDRIKTTNHLKDTYHNSSVELDVYAALAYVNPRVELFAETIHVPIDVKRQIEHFLKKLDGSDLKASTKPCKKSLYEAEDEVFEMEDDE